MEKLIITAAICGAEVTKEQNPAVPYTVEEMVREAKSAYEAGAAILHIHVREDDGTPTQDRERFRVVMDAIRKELPDVIMIPSTGGATGMSPEERLQPRDGHAGLRHLQLRRRGVRQHHAHHARFRQAYAGKQHQARVRVLRAGPHRHHPWHGQEG